MVPLGLNWVKQLTKWVQHVNPLVCKGGCLHNAGWSEYEWIAEQAEFATDVLFQNRSKLTHLYLRLLNYALVNISANDILTFLGRKLNGTFLGEGLTDCKK